MLPLVSRQEMQALEQRAVDLGATWSGLMMQAATGIAAQAAEVVRDRANPRVTVLAGPGNNGGDALVAARMLAGLGVRISLLRFRRPDDRRYTLLRADPALEDLGTWPEVDAAIVVRALQQADLVLDGLLGSGGRPPQQELKELIMLVNAQRRAAPRTVVLAIDLPSGVGCDDGAVPTVAVQADLTVACGVIKRGLMFAPARDYVGRLVTVPLSLPEPELAALSVRRMTPQACASLLPARPRDGHKMTFGRVAVVAGSLRYPGAAVLATTAALRSGAGLATLAAPHAALALMTLPPELTLLPIAEHAGTAADDRFEVISELIAAAQAALIGPGLGRAPDSDLLVRRLLGLAALRRVPSVGFLAGAPPTPPQLLALPQLVIDADGLNILAETPEWFSVLPADQAVLTPHPGEMRRLLGTDALPADLVATVQSAAQQWHQTVVLKGSTTVVAAPDGRVAVLDAANPALATAGSGDVLAGTIAGLLAQGCRPFDAACLGVMLHSHAAARVAEALGDAGALAGDLLPELPRARRYLRGFVQSNR